MMRSKLLIEQGILKLDQDWSGLTRLTGAEKYERFFTNSFAEKVYYPSYSDDYIEDRPIEITIELSKQT